MIKIVVFSDKENNIRKFSVSGHARYAKRGEDIVCAAVSALTFTLLNGLDTLADVKTDCKVESGFVEYTLPAHISDEQNEKAQLILNTIVLGFKSIRDSYKSFIEVFEEEV